jgi:hypothetical protein
MAGGNHPNEATMLSLFRLNGICPTFILTGDFAQLPTMTLHAFFTAPKANPPHGSAQK